MLVLERTLEVFQPKPLPNLWTHLHRMLSPWRSHHLEYLWLKEMSAVIVGEGFFGFLVFSRTSTQILFLSLDMYLVCNMALNFIQSTEYVLIALYLGAKDIALRKETMPLSS